MKITKDKKHNIYFAMFPNQYELTSTLIRMQEFYESPFKNIRGKYFTLDEYMDTEAKHKGNFTYFSDWNGFNIPGPVINNFYNTFIMSDGLRDKELILIKELFDMIPAIPKRNWYFIATHEKVKYLQGYINHETAHALYYLYRKYKSSVNNYILPKPIVDDIHEGLKKMGYTEEVFPDELNAWLATSTKRELHKRFGKRIELKHCEFFRSNFKKFMTQE